MSTVTSLDGNFFVLVKCVLWSEAELTAQAAGGTLAALTSSNVAEIAFPEGAFDASPACDSANQSGTGPMAWFGSWNGGVPIGTVFSINLFTGQIRADNIAQAAMWTRLVLATPTR